ncbi:uncharacterized protein LOC143453066 [Clavelina lepadiformis]|uniref:uncharacterized protein LOC143453066 n=1 Tax=Clavelina lepadiformis TaxID=159417 RepID=UPI004040F344
MAQVLSATKQKTKVTTSFQSYEASSLKTSWDKEDLLGRGSFATARRCIHDQLGRVVAKCFKVKGPSKDMEKVMKNVEREMKVLYRLKHQHIVAVHGITEWSNCIGIIMEYAEAGNLDFFLWLPGDIADIPLLLKLRFSHQISDGLRYLHHHDKKRSYLHCDLKPENILLTPDLMVKIADFGSVAIATRTGATGGSFTITSNTQHTPFYTAPELLRDMLSDKKPSMDVYSYGMVLYAILTRRPAFSSDNPISGAIIEVIKSLGQKPYQPYLDNAESSLKNKLEDLQIFLFLKDIMVRCWDFEVKSRPDIQRVYDEIDEKLRSLKKYDVTYHISDLKKNEEAKQTPSSVKIELSEFSSPFEVGPQPSTAYLPTSEQSSSTSSTSIQDEVNAGSTTLTTRESPAMKQATFPDQIGLVANVETEQSTSVTSIQDKVNEGVSTLTIRESPIQKQIMPTVHTVTKIKPKIEPADGAVGTASDAAKISSRSTSLTNRESPGMKQEMSGHLKSIPAAETVKDLKQNNEPADGDDETFQEMTSKDEPEHRTSETASDLSETLQVMKVTVNEGKSRSSDLKINVNSEISSSYKKQLPEASYTQTNAGDDKQMPTQMIVQAEVYDHEEANGEVADDLQIVLIKQSLQQPEVATSETSTLLQNNSNADVDNNESIKESNHGSSVEDPKKAAGGYYRCHHG